jgi:hypothetical protein
MNPASSNLFTSCRMVSRLSGVYLLSFSLTGLYDGSMPNLCSITFLGIPGIYDIWHAKTLRLSWRKMMSVSFYLGSRSVLIQSVLSGCWCQPELPCHQPPSSGHPPADRWDADRMARQHMCLSLLKEVEGC